MIKLSFDAQSLDRIFTAGPKSFRFFNLPATAHSGDPRNANGFEFVLVRVENIRSSGGLRRSALRLSGSDGGYSERSAALAHGLQVGGFLHRGAYDPVSVLYLRRDHQRAPRSAGAAHGQK